ncbi:Hypothetical predicted protein [Paramuricea clavata]|uniref:Uncharacterized protein n=1 Tax=Paramuricea clavata TaxID=317549 RepID=A0A6S7G848_PARCT|nr:Hypothetical predicted protein [Paramuricea clavata]
MTDRPYLLEIPGNKLTVQFYNALRKKIGIEDNVTRTIILFFLDSAVPHRSPRNLVKYLAAYNDANHKTVRKLFETQFEIKWQTESGDPDLFSFYGFCKDVVNRTSTGRGRGRGRGRRPGRDPINEVMTYKTRRAHVLSKLYHAQDELHKIRDLTYQKLCPPVYARKDDGTWVTFTFEEKNASKAIRFSRQEPANIGWISNEDLRVYIQSNSVKEYENFPSGKGQLYWAVLEEDDFDNQVQDFGRTQVYVGQAVNGIKERWMGGGKSHCKRMGVARDVMCNMLSYDPTPLQSEQLVDLRLLLHKAWNQDGENSGLFIMDKFTKEGTGKQKKITGDASKLGQAEKDNIDGKKASTSNEFILTENWNPKDMRYGMNGK